MSLKISKTEYLSAIAIVSSALAAAVPGAAIASADAADAAADGSGYSDIVVTAERRETRLQTTPLSVGVAGHDLLRDQGLTNISELSGVVAGLQTNASTSIIGYASIRGIGSVLSPFQSPVAIYVDDVMWARQMNNAAFNLPDVERIEVLRGPQGTLYGLNSSAGAIRLISRAPDDTLRGEVSASIGSYDLLKASLYTSGPIVPGVLAASIAYSHQENDGYTRNETLDRNVNAIRSDQLRVKFRLTPPSIEGLDATLSLLVLRDRSDSPGYAPVNVANPDPYLSYDSVDPRTRNNAYAGSLNISYPVGDTVTLRSITGYRSFKAENPWSISGLASPQFYWQNNPNQRQWSQELQANADIGKLNVTAGAIYFNEKFDIERNQNSLGAFSGIVSSTRSESFGVFAQGRYAVSDRLGITAGGRYYNQTDKFNIRGYSATFFGEHGPTTFERNGLRQKTDGFTPKIGVDYKLSDDVFAYASFTTGAKAGGFWPTSGSAQSAAIALLPEKVKTYEAGLKTSAFDKKLIVNVTGFYNDFKNFQTQLANVIFNGVLVSGSVTLNAQKARTYGVEAELTAQPVPGLTAQVNATVLKADFTEFNVAQTTGTLSFDGKLLPGVSPVLLTGRLGYEGDIGTGAIFGLRGEVRYQKRSYHTLYNDINVIPTQTYVNVDAQISTPDKAWTLFGLVRNLFDVNKITSLSGTGVRGINSRIYSQPRTIEVGIRRQF